MDLVQTETTLSPETEISDSADIHLLAVQQPEPITSSTLVATAADSFNEPLQRTAALYLLTLKEKYKLTQTAIDFTVSQTKLIVDKIVEDLSSAVRKEVASIADYDASRVLSVFENIRNPFVGLETHYFQSKYIQEHFGIVVSSHLAIAVHKFNQLNLCSNHSLFILVLLW